MVLHLATLLLLALVSQCLSQTDLYAAAVLYPTANSSVFGVVFFHEADGTVVVTGTITGLSPFTFHGFHIHEYGYTLNRDGTSTGGHYNPAKVPHSCPPQQRHVGDMGNLLSDSGGNVKINLAFPTSDLSLSLPATTIIGRGVILHGGEDDCVTQPTGNAGNRLAQGVVGWSPVPAH